MRLCCHLVGSRSLISEITREPSLSYQIQRAKTTWMRIREWWHNNSDNNCSGTHSLLRPAFSILCKQHYALKEGLSSNGQRSLKILSDFV